MRILFLLPSMRIDGGVESSMATFANEIGSMNHKVYVVAVREGGTLSQKLRSRNVKLIVLDKQKTLPGKIGALYRIIKKNKIDIVHTCLFEPGVIGRVAGLINNCALVSVEQSTFFPAWHWYHYLIDRFLARRTHCNIAVSNSVAVSLASRTRVFPYNIEILSNPVDTKLFKNKGRNRPCNRNKKVWKLLLVGRLEVVKNIELAIQIAKKLKNHNIRFELKIYGNGVLFDYYLDKIKRSKVKDCVFLKGTSNKIHEIMQNSDILLLTSHWEGCNTTIIEAYASGLPVVANRVQGNTDIVDNCITGMLFRRGNAKDASDKIIEIMANHKLRKEIVINANEYAKEFDSKRLAKKLLKYYRLALSRRDKKISNENLHTTILNNQIFK